MSEELWIVCPNCLYARTHVREDPDEVLPRCTEKGCFRRMRTAPLYPDNPRRIERPREPVPVCKMNRTAIASGSCVDKNYRVGSDTGSGQLTKGGDRHMATQTQEQGTKTDFVTALLKGIENVKSRDDGSVHTIKAEDGKTTVAEICQGKRDTRLNFKAEVPSDMIVDELALNGQSKSWAGGGCKITDENLTSAKQTLDAVVASIQSSGEDETSETETAAEGDGPSVEEAETASEQSQGKRSQARKRTSRSSAGSRAKANA